MNKLFSALSAVVIMTGGANAKTLIAYYSQDGNTATVAEEIANQTGADMFLIETVDPNHYPSDPTNMANVARQEIADNTFVAIKSGPDMTEYDTVFIGTPVWFGTVSTPVKSFLSANNLRGKRVIPFVTYETGGAGTTFTDISEMTVGSNNLNGLAISDANTSSSNNTVRTWLTEIDVLN